MATYPASCEGGRSNAKAVSTVEDGRSSSEVASAMEGDCSSATVTSAIPRRCSSVLKPICLSTSSTMRDTNRATRYPMRRIPPATRIDGTAANTPSSMELAGFEIASKFSDSSAAIAANIKMTA